MVKAMKYWIRIDGTSGNGPFTKEELISKYGGRLNRHTPCAKVGEDVWAELSDYFPDWQNDIFSSLDAAQGAPAPSQLPTSDFPAFLCRRYSDAYTGAHTVVLVGKIIKGTAIVLFILMLIAGFAIASGANGLVAGIGFAFACLTGIPTYVLGILVAAQGQTTLATLDTAVNSSRHLNDDDVARVLAKRFNL